jgi:hypothetical protein
MLLAVATPKQPNGESDDIRVTYKRLLASAEKNLGEHLKELLVGRFGSLRRVGDRARSVLADRAYGKEVVIG